MKFEVRWKLHAIWSMVVVLLVGLTYGQDKSEKAEKSDKKANDEYYELMRTFADTFEQVERNYVKKVDRKKMLEAALRGMLVELDPYSSYISPEELAQFNQSVDQEFGGIGIQVQKIGRAHV